MHVLPYSNGVNELGSQPVHCEGEVAQVRQGVEQPTHVPFEGNKSSGHEDRHY